MKINKKGFTLIEILVAVLIIGVLVMIVVPIYQTAVDKSKYSAMMQAGKGIATAQESFYLTNGNYTTDLAKLDVDFAKNLSGYSSTVATDITANLSDKADYDYVKMTRNGMNNNYIIYLTGSENYPNEIHCEALKNNDRAIRLCEKLGGKRLHGSLTEGYNTYVLEGSGRGMAWTIATTMQGVQCEASENSGNKSCTVEKFAHSVVKTVCTNKNDPKTCKYYIYDEDAYVWECLGSKSKLVDGDCLATTTGTYLTRWDEDGNKVERQCDSYDKNKKACSQLAERTYNPLNTKVEADRRYCDQYDDDGRCIAYKQNQGYDSFGNLSGADPNNPTDFGTGQICRGSGQAGTFDCSNTTTHWTQVNCAAVDEDGECTSYKDGWLQTSTWNDKGMETFRESTICSSITSDKECGDVSKYIWTQGSYNDNGKLDTKIGRECLTKDSSGNCTEYAVNSDKNFQQNYTYDNNKNTLSDSTYKCATVSNETTCATYKSSNVKEYTYNNNNQKLTDLQTNCSSYDPNNNCTKKSTQLTEYTYAADKSLKPLSEVHTNCASYNSSNQCTKYDSVESKYRTFEGKEQTSWTSVKCNKYEGTECTGGWKVIYTPMKNGKDDTANRETIDACMNVDMTKGECLD